MDVARGRNTAKRASGRAWIESRPLLTRLRAAILACAAAALGIALVTLVLHPLRGHLNPVVVALAYLSVVLLVAVKAETPIAVATAGLAFLAFDFYFIRPFDTLAVGSGSNVLALVSFAIVSVGAIEVIGLLRRQALEAESRERVATSLSTFSALLLAEFGESGLPAPVMRDAARLLDAIECALLASREGGLVPFALSQDRGGVAPAFVVDDLAQAALRTCKPLVVEMPGESRLRSPASAKVLYLPLAVEDRLLGVLVAMGTLHDCRVEGGPLPPTILAVGRVLALALDRARLLTEASRLEGVRQSNEFKTILLAAISHDLKTPIAAIKATATGLLGTGARWDDDARRAELQAINEAADRLNRLVTNLLDLSRIEADAVHPKLDWCDLHDLVGSSLANVGVALDERRVSVEIPDDLPLVRVDFVLIVQVLTNLLDNAARYTRPGGRIEIRTLKQGSEVIVMVSDDGPGIAASARPQIFEKFNRGETEAGTARPGAGLGLAIGRGLVEKHGGRIWVADSPLGGASIAFSLPQSSEARVLTEVSDDVSKSTDRG